MSRRIEPPRHRSHRCKQTKNPQGSGVARSLLVFLLWSVTLAGIAVPLSVQAASQALDINSGELIIEDYELWNWRSSAFTIEWWWSPDSLSSSSFAVPIIQYADGAYECAFFAVDSKGGGYIGQYDQFGEGVVRAGRWQHFAFTYSGGTGKFYKNGTLIATTPTDLFSQACRGWNRGVKFVGGGKIDDVRIWNTARTQTQIQENRSRMLRGTTSGLECYLTFETESFASGNWDYRLKDETGKQEVHFLSWNPAFAAGPSLSLPQNTLPVAQNNQFTISGYDYLTNTLRATDADGDSLTYQISSQPEKGTVRLTNAATGAFTYTPNQGASGTDTFTFTAHDGVAPSAQATITITITPLPEPIAGGAGQAMVFDGQNDYVTMAGFDTWQPSQFTVEWWLNPRTHKNWNQKIESPNGWGRFVFHTTENGSVYAGTDMGQRFTPSQLGAGTVTLNTWQHFAFTFNNGTGKFYKNGRLLASKTGMAHPLPWGGFKLNTDGLVDDVRIWNVARSAEQIASAMQQHVASDTTGLEASWTFDADSGTLASDATGRHDGTLHNMDPAAARVTSAAPTAAASVWFTFPPGSAHNSFSETLPGVTSRGERGMDVFCVSSSPDDALVDTNMYSPEYQPCNPDGTFTFYYPEKTDQSSPDIVEFTYNICRMYKDSPDRPFAIDYSACSPDQAVRIKIDGRPSISGPLSVTLAEDTPYTGTLSGFDWDPSRIELLDTGSKGSVTLQDSSLTTNQFDAQYQYTPNLNATGPDAFRVRVTDAAGHASTVTVALTITPVNDSPAAPRFEGITAEDTPFSATVQASDPDEGDHLTFSLTQQPGHGTVTLAGDRVAYTPELNFFGNDAFTMSVSDGQLRAEIPASMTITPVNDAPEVSGSASVTTTEDTPVSASVPASDPDPGDQLRFSVSQQPAHGTVTLDGDRVTYTPAPDFTGNDSFSIDASDSEVTTPVSFAVQVTPVNDAPVAANDSYYYHEADGDTLAVSAPGVLSNDADIDQDPMTARQLSNPQHGTVTLNSDGSFTYRPDPDYRGLDRFTYAAVDQEQVQSGATEVVLTVRALNIGEIPSFSVYEGKELRFPVYSRILGPGAVFSHQIVSGTPSGTLNFAPDDALLTYTPGENERIPFSLLFTAEAEGKTVSQTVQITPVPVLNAEAEVIGLHTAGDPLPDDAVVENVVASDEQLFNLVHQSPKKVSIAGKTVKLNADSNVYKRYNKADDIEELTIYAETVIISSPLHLHQTTVTIYARDLKFEGNGQLITTPKEFTNAALTAHGSRGADAGNITLYINTFTSTSSQAELFVMKGGSGEDVRLSVPTKYVTRTRMVQWCFTPPFTYPPIPRCTMVPQNYQVGYKEYAGKAGDGGDGGILQATLDAPADHQSADAGEAGVITNPPPSPKVYTESDIAVSTTNPDYITTLDKTSPSSPGNAGSFAFLDVGPPELAWVSPHAMNAILTYVNDSYLAGHFDDVMDVLNESLEVLEKYKASSCWQALESSENAEWQQDLTLIQLEMQTIKTRLASHMDYFGHPAGWVPMLSFEVTKETFSNEIQHAAKILYLSSWLEHSADIKKERLSAVDDAIRAAQASIDADIESFKQALKDLTPLTQKLDALKNSERNLQGSIARRMEELERQADKNLEQPAWKKTLKGIGQAMQTVSAVVPVGQPYVAAAGFGASTLADLVTGGSPEEALQASLEFSLSNFSDYQQNADTIVNSEDPAERSLAVQKVLQHLVDTTNSWKTLGTPQSEVEREVARLKAQDSAYQDLVHDLDHLLKEKAKTMGRLAMVSEALRSLPVHIEQSRLAKIALTQCKRDELKGILTQRALDYVRKMKRQAQDRLLRYQYYMARAYEYRFLTDYDDSNLLTPGNIVTAVEKIAEDLNNTYTSPEVVKASESMTFHLESATREPYDSETFLSFVEAIYQDQLGKIANEIYTNLINGTPSELTSTSPRITLDESRYATLNAGQPVRINLVDEGLIDQSEEALRIVDIWVDSVEMYDFENNKQYTIQCPPDTKSCWSSGDDDQLSGSVQIDIRHSGISKLQRKGQVYKFWHANEEEETSPFLWRSKIHTNPEEISQVKRSAAQASLIASLINKTGVNSENILLYTRPALWSDLIITKSGDEQYQITRLGIKVEYDYYSMPSTLVKLDVRSEGIREDSSSEALEAVIDVSPSDKEGRDTGAGQFSRIYEKDTSVTLTAPQRYGVWRFSAWQEWSSNKWSELSAAPTLERTLEKNQRLRARYDYAPDSGEITLTGPDGEIANGGVYSFGQVAGQTSQTFTITNITDAGFTVYTLDLASAVFTVTPETALPLDLAANGAMSFTVTYTPADASVTEAAEISIPANTPGAPPFHFLVRSNPSVPEAHALAFPIADDSVLQESLSGTDADGDSLTYHLADPGSKGQVELDEQTGGFTYTPRSGIGPATDTFAYTVSDGAANSAEAEVTITMSGTDAPPVAGFNTALSLDAADACMKAVPQEEQRGPFTIELLVKAPQGQADGKGVFATSDSPSAPSSFQIEITDDTWQVRGMTRKNLGFLLQIGKVTNHWQHLAVTFDGSTITTYLDGKRQKSYSPSFSGVLQVYKIGTDRQGWNGIEGLVDEVRIWKHARTETQIRQMMHLAVDPQEEGLAAYWHFDEGGGGIAYDATPHGANGVLYGNVVWSTTFPIPVDVSLPKETSSFTGVLPASDTENTPLTYTLTQSPAPGKLETIANDGTFTYTLNDEVERPALASFQYHVSDKEADSPSQTVDIIIGIVADMNLNEIHDCDDLKEVRTCYNEAEIAACPKPHTQGCAKADLSGDGCITEKDYLWLKRYLESLYIYCD